jgi:hypothetical protein
LPTELRRINLESLLPLNVFLFSVNITLALENSHLDGTDIAVIARYCFAIAASLP